MTSASEAGRKRSASGLGAPSASPAASNKVAIMAACNSYRLDELWQSA